MATSRDARVTEKNLKDVQYVYSAQTQQKGINRMASPTKKFYLKGVSFLFLFFSKKVEK